VSRRSTDPSGPVATPQPLPGPVEGIESVEQAMLIASFGTVLGQGYQLGRPMAVSAMDGVLTANVLAHRGTGTTGRVLSHRPRPRLVTLPAPTLKDLHSPLAG